MAKIQIYGDSFADPGPWGDTGTWSHLLASKYGHKVTNFGKAGCSIEWCILNLTKQFQNGGIDETDVVIYLSGYPYRIHFNYLLEHPEKAAAFTFNVVENEISSCVNDWYYINKNYLEWFIVNRDTYNLTLNYTAYIHFINSMAIKFPEKTFIIIQQDPTYGLVKDLLFFSAPNLLFVKDFSLHLLHEEELVCSQNEFLETTYGDLRINHMSKPNHDLLARELQKIIETKNLSGLRNDIFHKRLFEKPFTSTKEILNYVEKGLLLNHDNIHLRLREKYR
jgi:hypothetical protein